MGERRIAEHAKNEQNEGSGRIVIQLEQATRSEMGMKGVV
jgi:hypothetical protein